VVTVTADTASPGTAALADGGDRVDFPRLRTERRERLLAAMAEHHLDVLMLGRAANISYASGARQLWTAGARPFGPGCVVVAADEQVHLLSTWDEGVPADIPHDRLYGLAWNPANLMANLAAVPGLARARRVGTDGWSPGAPSLIAALAPDAEVLDGTPALTAARSVKTADEIACLLTAAAVAEGALAAMAAAVRPGATERQLLGVHAAALCRAGLPTPPSEAVAVATPRRGPVRLRRLATDRPIGPGELVVLTAGAMCAGYEATLGRSWLPPSSTPSAHQRDLVERARAARDALVAACRPGATGADLAAVWNGSGPAPATDLWAWGVGLGMELPLFGPGLGATAGLRAGMVLAVQAGLAEEGAGGALESDLVLVDADGPRVLTRFGPCPAI
jgi:Xaa-Pro dipeptidase